MSQQELSFLVNCTPATQNKTPIVSKKSAAAAESFLANAKYDPESVTKRLSNVCS